MEKNKTIMAVDFGNSYIRIALKLNDQIYSLENEDSVRRFPQILALDGEYTYFGFEAENNLIGYYNSYFKDFNYKSISSNGNDQDPNISFITKILAHYKQMSIEFLKKHYQQEINDIDTIIIMRSVIDTEKKWCEILSNCSTKAGFKKFYKDYEEMLAINYYKRKNSIEVDNGEMGFYIFNLGCLSFNLSKWIYRNKTFTYSILKETKGGFSINILLQNLFNRKIREIIEKTFLNSFIKPEYFDFEKLFNNDVFESNTKFKAECDRMYLKVLDIFSGKSKSMQLQFRHIINKQEIEIEILRKDIDEIFSIFRTNVQKIIDAFKSCLNKNSEKTCTIIIGNGIKIPGVKELFVSELKEDFLVKNIFNSDEILKEALLRDSSC
jgi:hypothetical protein